VEIPQGKPASETETAEYEYRFAEYEYKTNHTDPITQSPSSVTFSNQTNQTNPISPKNPNNRSEVNGFVWFVGFVWLKKLTNESWRFKQKQPSTSSASLSTSTRPTIQTQ
jgi:hypothetical protein